MRVGDVPASSTPFSIWEELAHWFKSFYGVNWGGDFSDPDLAQSELNHFYLPGQKCESFL